MRWTRRTTSTSASTSSRGPASYAFEERPPPELAEHVPRLLLAERRDADGRVAEHLHQYAAEPDGHGGPEQRVVGDADDHLDPALDHLADQDAVEVDTLVAGDVGEFAIGVPDLAGRGQTRP